MLVDILGSFFDYERYTEIQTLHLHHLNSISPPNVEQTVDHAAKQWFSMPHPHAIRASCNFILEFSPCFFRVPLQHLINC